MSKLYTQEQVKHMIDDAHNGIDGYYAIFKKHTPIELPTDEEIEEEVSKLKFSKEGYRDGVIEGMIWMRDKIKGEEDAREQK